MRSNAAFWDKAARRYADRPVSDMAAYEATLKRVRHHLRADHRVLELGCGTGTTALKLAPFVGQYTGTDVSPEMIAIAREKALAAGDGSVRFESAGLYEAGGNDEAGRHDAVLAFNLLHLLQDVPGALAHVHAILPEGGMFISKTPCLGRRKLIFKPVIRVLQIIGKAPHVEFMTVDELGAAMRAAGFEIVETGDYPKSLPSRFIVARRL